MADENQTDSVPSASVPLICASGCGFYGSPSTLNLCSKCFNDHQKRTSSADTTATPQNTHSPPVSAEPQQPPVAPPQEPKTVAISGKEAPEPVPAPEPVASQSPAPPLVAAASATTVDASVPKVEDKEELPAKAKEEEPLVEEERAKAAVVDQSEVALAEVKEALPVRKVQKNTSRCFACKKKIGLTGFKCRCGYVYCAIHRYADAHQCDFDYKTAGREQISKDNPLVVAAKLEKI